MTTDNRKRSRTGWMLDELTGEIMIPTYKLKLCDGLAKVVGRKYAGRSELTRVRC